MQGSGAFRRSRRISMSARGIGSSIRFMTRSFLGMLVGGSVGRPIHGRWLSGLNLLLRTSCLGCLPRRSQEAGQGCEVRDFDPGAAGGARAAPARRRPADRNRASAAGEERGTGDRHRRAAASTGELTSDSTRTDGYVLSTNVAPTILRRFGISVPAAMYGQPIRGEGSDGVASPRIAWRSRWPRSLSRRGPVVGSLPRRSG